MSEENETITVFECGICKLLVSPKRRDEHEYEHQDRNQGLPWWREVVIDNPRDLWVIKYNNPELRTNTRQTIPTIILNHRPSNNERIRMY